MCGRLASFVLLMKVEAAQGYCYKNVCQKLCANDASQPAARHFNSGSHVVSDMKIRALCPISGGNDSRKRHEMRLISKLGTLHPLDMNEHFSYI